jgi:hypothetical protein
VRPEGISAGRWTVGVSRVLRLGKRSCLMQARSCVDAQRFVDAECVWCTCLIFMEQCELKIRSVADKWTNFCRELKTIAINEWTVFSQELKTKVSQ